jgi:hypothetical protein
MPRQESGGGFYHGGQRPARAPCPSSLFNGKDLTGWTPKLKGYDLGENAVSRVNKTMRRLHFSIPEKSGPGDGYGCYAHAKSEHGEPRRYPIRGVSSAGMTSAALHARENASMAPRERHGRLGLIGKTGISRRDSRSLSAPLFRFGFGFGTHALAVCSPVNLAFSVAGGTHPARRAVPREQGAGRPSSFGVVDERARNRRRASP